MSTLLLSHDVKSYDPEVIHALVEISQSFTDQILEDAQSYAEHASRSTIEAEDVALALAGRPERSSLVDRDEILRIARERNAIPLTAWDEVITGGGEEGIRPFTVEARDLDPFASRKAKTKEGKEGSSTERDASDREKAREKDSTGDGRENENDVRKLQEGDGSEKKDVEGKSKEMQSEQAARKTLQPASVTLAVKQEAVMALENPTAHTSVKNGTNAKVEDIAVLAANPAAKSDDANNKSQDEKENTTVDNMEIDSEKQS